MSKNLILITLLSVSLTMPLFGGVGDDEDYKCCINKALDYSGLVLSCSKSEKQV